jgi:hypothetical protein
MLLSDMGAEVLRVDRAQAVMGGDPSRPPTDVLNRGRRSIGVDLKNPDGVQTVLRLVEQADALIEGFRPGVAERLGIGPDDCLANRRAGLNTVWSKATGPLGVAGRAALSVSSRLGPVADQTYRPQNGVSYPGAWPSKELADALRDTAQLIRADVGAEIISVDYGSWDMHSEYGSEDVGQMQSMVTGFAQSVNAFLRDLGTLRSRVTVVTISEFGRRVTENGNRGLDHGWGNMMLLMGAAFAAAATSVGGPASRRASSRTATSRSPPTTATCSARSSPVASRTGRSARSSPVSPTARWA